MQINKKYSKKIIFFFKVTLNFYLLNIYITKRKQILKYLEILFIMLYNIIYI